MTGVARIAGVTTRSPDAAATAATWLDAAVARLGVPEPCRVSQLRTPLGALACCSRGADAAWRREPDGLALVLDGAIYNLEELGFAPGAEAEAVASLTRRRGFPEALAALNGDFAVALFEPGSGALWLGRDRFGIRPLYYAQGSDRIAFASRCAALLGLPGVSRRTRDAFVACVAAGHYRSFDNDPWRSPYRDVSQLPAAHWLRWREGTLDTGAYWTLAEQPDWEADAAALAEQYRELLLDAVGRRFARAPAPAFTLSGGMDSSSVLSCAVTLSGSRQTAYSTVYEDPTYDESGEIREILERTVERWRAVSVGEPDVFALIAEMIEAHDEPVATATWLSHYLLCREAAAEGVETLFGGLGGDELNAGEYEYFFFHFADLRSRGEEERLHHEVDEWIEHHDHPVFRKSHATMREVLARVVDPEHPGRCLPDRARLDRYAALLDPDFFRLERFEPVMDHPFRSYLKNRTYQDIFRETAPCCLRAQDRQGAAFGLVHRLPFFDHRLVEFMFRVPGDLKIRDGVTKVLLREAVRGIVPEATRRRIAKTGWNAPAHRWFAGKNLERLRDLVGSRSFRERGIYAVPELLRVIDEHERIVRSGEPRENHMMLLWQMVNLELWLQSLDTGRYSDGT